MNRVKRAIGILLLLGGVGPGAYAADALGRGASSAVPLLIPADIVCKSNPYWGRKRRCAAFARFGLYLLTGKQYITYGSAHLWARHAEALKATLPLLYLRPGDLIFFRDRRHRINHVAIVLQQDHADVENFAIIFQDERGTHCWASADPESYLGMRPVFGADPAKLETRDS